MLISKNFLTREASYKPSCLISWTHSGPEGGRATFDGWHGSMKAEGRRTITYGICIETILSHRQTPSSTVR